VASEAQAHHDLALGYLEAGRAEDAEREFLRALALDPAHDEILLDLAKLHIRGDSLAEAETNLRGYLAAHPRSPLALGLAGEVKFREKDYGGAERYLTQALALRPDDGVAHKLLALCFGASGQWDLARPHLDRAVGLLPADEEAHYWRGRCLLETLHYNEATTEFQEALKLRPEFVKGYDNLGLCYDRLQRFDPAAENYRRAIELDGKLGSHYVWPYINLGSLLNHLRRYDEAVELLEPLAAWDLAKSQAAAVRYHLGRARLGLRQYDKAESELQRASQLDPTLALPHYQMGRLYKLLGKPEEARRELEVFTRLAHPSQGNRSLY
jgi:tetratricopeptide (TPR) repeat protein